MIESNSDFSPKEPFLLLFLSFFSLGTSVFLFFPFSFSAARSSGLVSSREPLIAIHGFLLFIAGLGEHSSFFT